MDGNADEDTEREPQFNRERHVRYHLRCVKTLLPTLYTGNDSNRMLLAFFVLNALDLLSALDTGIDKVERHAYINWVYHCQLEDGGFRGFPGTYTGMEPHKRTSMQWDPAHIAGTFFALEVLILLGDRLERVKRIEALRWLQRLQLPDGSFGELLDHQGQPSGGQDIRFCYMAAAIRYMLCGNHLVPNTKDIDVEALGGFVLRSQCYDGGFGRQFMEESHAGWTYCAISCLHILGQMPQSGEQLERDAGAKTRSSFSVYRLLHWLASRQIPCPETPESDEEAENTVSYATNLESDLKTTYRQIAVLSLDSRDILCAGLNGRNNKPADTCYSFWAVAGLDILGYTEFLDKRSNRRYLLERTEHRIGGFGKMEGDPPDILHSSLGLAALSFMGEQGVKKLDPVFCLSHEKRRRMEDVRAVWASRVS